MEKNKNLHVDSQKYAVEKKRFRVSKLLFGVLTALAMVASVFAPTARADAPPVLGPPFGPEPDDSVLRYVALGDSYAALGASAENNFTGDLPRPYRNYMNPDPLSRSVCLNTFGNYPSFVAEALGAYVIDVSCASADTDHYFGEQFPGITKAQMLALTPETDLVTISFGGNDARVAWLSYGCIAGSLIADLNNSACAWFLEEPHNERFAMLPEKMDRMLQDVKHRAPNAIIILTGYMNVLDEGNMCEYFEGLYPVDVEYVVNWQKRINRIVEEAAHRNGVLAVGTDMIPGHDVCAAPADRWVGAIGFDTSSLPGHPTVAGQKHMASRVVDAYHQEKHRRENPWGW
ncbi:MAG TPA: SGNH/GDSL hydrolase family protein [Corynebacteriales bacterium]|nr:SGNH/GDSL hydrolase family protein [Mycobacteriales bacterium]